MNKAFEIFGGLLILVFMGVVVWQSTTNKDSDNLVTEQPTEEIEEKDINQDEVTPVPDKPASPEDGPIACTQEAKICPDGSAVGRTGPNCEFTECPVPEEEPEENQKSITCSPESKLAQACTMDYTPVCGLVEIQCFTTPCNPIPETFSNACGACSQGNVISYTEGACEE